MHHCSLYPIRAWTLDRLACRVAGTAAAAAAAALAAAVSCSPHPSPRECLL